jgi:hypothetical protein
MRLRKRAVLASDESQYITGSGLFEQRGGPDLRNCPPWADWKCVALPASEELTVGPTVTSSRASDSDCGHRHRLFPGSPEISKL